MKLILAFVLSFCFTAFANSPGAIGVRGPVGSAVILDTSSTSVTSGAWVTYVAAASMLYACSAIQIHNTGSQPIKIGVGAAAAEVDTGALFPIGVSILLPINLKKGVRVAVRSMGGTQSSGFLTFSCLQ